MFLSEEQQSLAAEIGAKLAERGETVAVAESTAGGLVSAALLSVGGASKYYRGGGVVYTLASRTALAGVDAQQYANYQGTTPEMLASLAESMRQRLDATWCIAESGTAGPGGGRFGSDAGDVKISVAGPVTRGAVIKTGIPDRVENMAEFATQALRYLNDAIKDV
jgi:PncC family amidohydrolase